LPASAAGGNEPANDRLRWLLGRQRLRSRERAIPPLQEVRCETQTRHSPAPHDPCRRLDRVTRRSRGHGPDPLDPNRLIAGGDWSAYWYNGFIYESDRNRGLMIWNPSSPAVAGALGQDHLNPQTFEFTL
jgi:hypothetical protein